LIDSPKPKGKNDDGQFALRNCALKTKGVCVFLEIIKEYGCDYPLLPKQPPETRQKIYAPSVYQLVSARDDLRISLYGPLQLKRF
jgi:hypothetical protein